MGNGMINAIDHGESTVVIDMAAQSPDSTLQKQGHPGFTPNALSSKGNRFIKNSIASTATSGGVFTGLNLGKFSFNLNEFGGSHNVSQISQPVFASKT